MDYLIGWRQDFRHLGGCRRPYHFRVEKIPGLEVVPLGWCIEAMDRAFERVRSTGWNDPVGAYAAVAVADVLD
jgi:hypothetical protein